MPKNPNKASLGLGLGLNPNQRAQFRAAAQGGTLTDFLGRGKAGKRAGRRIGKIQNTADDPRFNTLAGYINQNNAPSITGQQQGIGPSTATAAGPAPASNNTPAPMAGNANTGNKPLTFQDILNQQFGQGNPFANPTFSNFNDLANKLQNQSNYGLQQNLAGIRSRYGSQGLGTSSREALAEGSATGQAQSDLNAQIGQLGQQARESDLNRALSALGLGSQTALAEQQLPLQALQMLLGAGNDLYGGARADQPRLIDLITSLLTNFGTTSQTGFGRTGV